MAAKKHKLKLSKLEFLSLVDTPAQEPATVRLVKRAEQGDEIEVKATARIVKVDSGDDPLIYAWAFQCVDENGQPYSDRQGDTITPDFVKAAEEFVRAGGAVDTMHNGQQSSHVAFAFPMDSDIAKAMFGAPGEAVKTVGLMTAIRPSAEDLAKVRSGEYTGVSIAGSGIREALKSASQSKCPSCGAYVTPESDGTCPKCGKTMKRAPEVAKGVWSTADVDSLPDSSFLYIESGGSKDSDGKTTPRSLRHFPYKDSNGTVDLPHLRDAIGRIPQSSLPKDLRDKLQVKAEKLLAAQHDKASKRITKQAVLTSSDQGHQHQLDLDDPADQWFGDKLRTSDAVADGADISHSHDWVVDLTTGKITIAESAGHSHSVDAVVPPDVLRQAALNSDGERCTRCGEMCESDCRFCPNCGCAMNGSSDGVPMAMSTDDNSAAAPAVVVISARAPEPISTPSEGTPTVKSEPKEPSAMTTDLNAKIRELEAQNAHLAKMATLTDAQRAHFAKLSGDDAATFLNLAPAARQNLMDDIAKADTVVYTSMAGREFRKSDDLRLIELAQQADASMKIAQQAEIQKREMEFAKRGDETIPHFAKGVKGNLRGRIMKALDGEFKDPAEFEEATRALKAADYALGDMEKAKGVNPHAEPATFNPVAKQLQDRVEEFAKRNNMSYAAAFVQATAVDPEIRRLYNESQLGN